MTIQHIQEQTIMVKLFQTLLVTFVVGILLAASPVQAAKTQWACWLHDGRSTAICMVMTQSMQNETQPVVAPTNRVRPQTAREYVQTLRERPSELQGQQVLVPLFSEPADESFVTELMQAVLCGSGAAARSCEARYHHDMSRFFAHAPALFVDMNDPFLDELRG